MFFLSLSYFVGSFPFHFDQWLLLLLLCVSVLFSCSTRHSLSGTFNWFIIIVYWMSFNIIFTWNVERNEHNSQYFFELLLLLLLLSCSLSPHTIRLFSSLPWTYYLSPFLSRSRSRLHFTLDRIDTIQEIKDIFFIIWIGLETIQARYIFIILFWRSQFQLWSLSRYPRAPER